MMVMMVLLTAVTLANGTRILGQIVRYRYRGVYRPYVYCPLRHNNQHWAFQKDTTCTSVRTYYTINKSSADQLLRWITVWPQ